MARGRMISTTIDLDPEFNALGMEAQLLYLRTIPHLDRDGLIVGNPFALWTRAAPLMECLAMKMPAIIEEWIAQELVIRYETKIGPILFFTGFGKNQGGMRYDREAPSRFEPPPGYVRTDTGLIPQEEQAEPQSSAGDAPKESQPPADTPPDSLPTNSGETPAQYAGAEVEVEVEVKVKGGDARAREAEPPTPPESPPLPASTPIPDLFGGRPRGQPREVRQVQELAAKLKALGVSPETYREMTDRLLDMRGLRALADLAEDDEALREAQDCVRVLATMQFKAVADIERILKSWQVNDWRGDNPPTYRQLIEHASMVRSGNVVCTRKPEPGQVAPRKGPKVEVPTFDAADIAARVERMRVEGVPRVRTIEQVERMQ